MNNRLGREFIEEKEVPGLESEQRDSHRNRHVPTSGSPTYDSRVIRLYRSATPNDRASTCRQYVFKPINLVSVGQCNDESLIGWKGKNRSSVFATRRTSPVHDDCHRWNSPKASHERIGYPLVDPAKSPGKRHTIENSLELLAGPIRIGGSRIREFR